MILLFNSLTSESACAGFDMALAAIAFERQPIVIFRHTDELSDPTTNASPARSKLQELQDYGLKEIYTLHTSPQSEQPVPILSPDAFAQLVSQHTTVLSF